MAKKKTTKDDAPTFEESLEKLQASLTKLEEGNLGLDATLAEYEAGVAQLRHCYQMLEAAERKVELLTGTNEDGSAKTKPFEDA